jgi:RecA/RadA recombinase
MAAAARAERPPRATAAEVAARVNDAMRAPVVRVGAQPTAWATISSGFPALDAITGLGGLPRGRFTELIGRPTSGRETIATRAAAAVGGATAWIDVTGALDVAYLAEHGVDLTRLYVLRPPAGQPREGLAMAERVVACGRFDLVVLDALADLPPCGETTMAVGRFVRVITPRLGAGQAALLVLSAPEHYHRPVAHAAALRLSLTRVGTLRRGGVFRGWRTRATVLKSPGLQGGESGLEVWL